MAKSGPKGAEGERQIARALSDLTGLDVKRKLGAGRKEDTGDLYGIPNTIVQVANWADTLRAIREKPVAAEEQRLNAGVDYAFSAVKFRGGLWRMVLTPEQMATYILTTIQRKEGTQL